MSYSGTSIGSVYNPSQLSKKGLVDRFVVRLRMFNRIYKLIVESKMEKPEEHLLIIGKRGMGKTTMLLRLAYQIEEDENVNGWMVPIVFNEEMYGIKTLADLWEKLAEYLEDKSDNFSCLLDDMEVIYGKEVDSEVYEEKAFKYLIKKLKDSNKKIVLFIDNFQDILPKFNKLETQRLREVLTTCPDIRIVGASPIIINEIYNNKYPLYEQLRTYFLKGLNKEETTTVLKKLGESYKTLEVNDLIENNQAKIETIRRITGGVIRTIVLLFEIFMDNKNGKTFNDLEIILDRVTPLYKGQTDKLPKNQQAIINAIAFNWDAITTKEISGKARLKSKIISAQLANLAKNDWIEIIPTNTKNHLYRLKERFYNIWFLMRYGRKKDVKKVYWLTRFLDEWLGGKGVNERANKLIQCLQADNYDETGAYYMTEALAQSEFIGRSKQHLLIETTRDFLSSKDGNLANQLSKSKKELIDKGIEILKSGDEEKAINHFNKSKKFKNIFNVIGYCYVKMKNYKKAEEFYLQAIENKDGKALFNLAYFYKEQNELEEAEIFYLKAIKKGINEALFNLANLYKEQNREEDAEKFYLQAIEKDHKGALNNLAILYSNQKKYEDAEEYYLKGIESGINECANSLAWMQYEYELDKSKGLKYAQIAVDNDKENIYLLHTLSTIQIWNDLIQESWDTAQQFLFEEEFYKYFLDDLIEYFVFLLAKEEYELVYEFFQSEEAQNINAKDRLKPIWYALMHFMREKYPNEYLKMGSELEETVLEIIESVKAKRVEYG